jgi:hypothetical protein
MSTKRYSFGIGAMGILIALSACGGSTGEATESSDSSQTATLNVDLEGDLKNLRDSDTVKYCPRTPELEPGYGVAQRLRARIVDINDEVLATSFSDPNAADPGLTEQDLRGQLLGGCTVTITFNDVPEVDFYTFQIDINENNFGPGTNSASITYSFDEMVENNWVADVTITTR